MQDTEFIENFDPALAGLEAEVGDGAYLLVKASGSGQNEMLQEWTTQWGPTFLWELYGQYDAPSKHLCLCSVPTGNRFRCDDCITSVRYCADCLPGAHIASPTHRISIWTGKTWSRTSLHEQNIIYPIGSHPGRCVCSSAKPLLLGDITGFHELLVTYCDCGPHSKHCIQLLRTGMMPCSTEKPGSAFTIRCLRLFDLLAADSKLYTSRYHAVMQRQNNNVYPHAHHQRLRELLRVVCEWQFLQLLKRNGQTTTTPKELGVLALRCPACPWLDMNYISADITAGQEYLFAQQLSYDGSFQLVRKNKAFDSFDLCLTYGLQYMVSQSHYRAHLEATQDIPSTEDTHSIDSCNNHQAANDTWVQKSGVVETGLGTVTCARHTLFMPQGCVSYLKGEHYVYTDYGIGSVMLRLMKEGATDIGVFYDIFCRWETNFWLRAPTIKLPEGQLTCPARFFGGIPKYHLAGHIDSCYAWYSLNNMHGAGQLDAEAREHAWANLNAASGSTSEKGPGSRINSLNHIMNDWNWRKTVTMISLLLRKWKEAVKMAAEQEEVWLTFHHSLKPRSTAEWAAMSTEAQKGKKGWTSVFLLSDTAVTTWLRTVLDLNSQESARIVDGENMELGFTAPTWLSEGIDIERLQGKLRQDIAGYGKKLTEPRRLEVYNRRTALSSRIAGHRKNGAHFLDLVVTNLAAQPSLAKETDGQPEHAVLYLPSHLRKRVSWTEHSLRMIQLEQTIREAECLETLRRVRTAAAQKSQMLIGKQKNAHREVANTRAVMTTISMT
ncbi:hypothetical protein RSAG8_11964, partial [Rhizoctonia solani AG-8 WAC10335]